MAPVRFPRSSFRCRNSAQRAKVESEDAEMWPAPLHTLDSVKSQSEINNDEFNFTLGTELVS